MSVRCLFNVKSCFNFDAPQMLTGNAPVLTAGPWALFYGGDYRQALTYVNEAAKFDNQRRSARSWKGYIQSTAKRKGVDL